MAPRGLCKRRRRQPPRRAAWLIKNPGHRRSATVVATTASRLQVVDQQSIQSLITSHPRAVFTLLRRTCAFLVDAERKLIGELQRRNDQLKETITRLDFTSRKLTQEEEVCCQGGKVAPQGQEFAPPKAQARSQPKGDNPGKLNPGKGLNPGCSMKLVLNKFQNLSRKPHDPKPP